MSKNSGGTRKPKPPDVLEEIRQALKWWEDEKKKIVDDWNREGTRPQLPGVKIDPGTSELIRQVRNLINGDRRTGLSVEDGLLVKLAATANLKRWKDELRLFLKDQE